MHVASMVHLPWPVALSVCAPIEAKLNTELHARMFSFQCHRFRFFGLLKWLPRIEEIFAAYVCLLSLAELCPFGSNTYLKVFSANLPTWKFNEWQQWYSIFTGTQLSWLVIRRRRCHAAHDHSHAWAVCSEWHESVSSARCDLHQRFFHSAFGAHLNEFDFETH